MHKILPKLLTLITIVFFTLELHSQNYTIQGSVKVNGKNLEAAVVEILNINKEHLTSGISDSKGQFSFHNLKTSDSLLYLKTSYIGLKAPLRKVNLVREKIRVNIEMEADPLSLEEITINGDKKVENLVTKTVFDINSRDFQKNSPTSEILNTIPKVSYDKINGVLVDNRKTGRIYIDGLESNLQFLETIRIEEIDKVEMIENPSAKLGSEFEGAVLNIITKKNSPLFLRGQLSAGVGVLRKSMSFFPTLSFKGKKITIRSYYNFLNNVQDIDYSLTRTSDNSFYLLESEKKPDITQQSAGVTLKYNWNKNSVFYTDFSTSIIDEDAIQKGYILQDEEQTDFKNFENSDFQRYHLNLSWVKNLSENDELVIKSKGFWYRRHNDFTLLHDTAIAEQTHNDTKSLMDEYSVAIDYNLKNKEFISRPITYYFGAKFINRMSRAQPEGFEFTQNIFSGFLEYSVDITEKLANFSSVYIERTLNSDSANFEQSYTNFLPTIIFQYKMENNWAIKYSFKKRIKRPSIYYLNNSLVYLNPGVAIKGNESLEPQRNISNEITMSKTIKKSYLSFTAYHYSVKDAITYNTQFQDNLLINFYDNIGRIKNTGASISYRSQFFKKINTNFSSGISYDEYTAPGSYESAENLQNEGLSYMGSISMNANLINKKLSISGYLRYQNPIYDLTTTTYKNPYSYIRVSTNMSKDRVQLSLLYNDLFNMYGQTDINLIDPFVNQEISILNKTSNLTFNISYNFGKNFRDYIRVKKIENKDLLSE